MDGWAVPWQETAEAPTSFRPVRSSHSRQTVLAVDSGLGMSEGGFPELASLLTSDCSVRELVPPVYRIGAWLREIETFGYDVCGVLGYCAGASLACALAEGITELSGSAPAVILFDPVPVTPDEFWYVFCRFVGTFREHVSEPELDEARERGRSVLSRCGTDFPALARELAAGYEPVVRKACEALELPDDLADDFVGRFQTQMDYMLAAAEYPFPATTSVSVILSQEGHDLDMVAANCQRIPVPHAELLTSPEVAAAVDRALSRPPKVAA